MAYVIYEIDTTRLQNLKYGSPTTYKTVAAAKAAITRLSKKTGINPRLLAVAEVKDFYKNIEKQVVRINMMTNQPYVEGVNTPYFCSPSSETYWSM